MFKLFPLLILACFIISCHSGHREKAALNHAESLMEAHPDSAMAVLAKIDKFRLGSKAERARYALLMSMALDKNYVDTTTFDVLQPAIDYYLEKGSPDEKLRTYYYQGRIFQNKGDRDKAMNSFTQARDHFGGSHDSLCMARTLVAQAALFMDFYDVKSYINNYLKAGNIYKNRSNFKNREFECLLSAWDGAIILSDKHRADSLMDLCEHFKPLDNTEKQDLQSNRLLHAQTFGSKEELRKAITHQDNILGHDVYGIMNLAYAYNELGNNLRAKQILDSLEKSDAEYDTLKFQSIYVSVLEDMGEYKDAHYLYKDYINRLESINEAMFEQKAQFIEEKHKTEVQAQNDARRKSKIIQSCLAGISILVMGIFILILLVRNNKTKKNLALQMAKATQIENEKLKSESEKLALENRNLQLERDKKALEAENLAHRVEMLENESESLKNLLQAPDEIPEESQQAIRFRLEMLNSLLAGHITDNDLYEKPYETWVKELTKNTEEFMNSNRLAFQASHPRFIRYFEEHNLTTDEINYVCLYAIGLHGKDVGNYLKKRSHVNTSSAIRKKLGIDKHETNIGIYVRRLLKSF